MEGRKSWLWSLLPLALFLLDLCFMVYYRRVIRVRELQTFSVGPLTWLNGYGALGILLVALPAFPVGRTVPEEGTEELPQP